MTATEGSVAIWRRQSQLIAPSAWSQSAVQSARRLNKESSMSRVVLALLSMVCATSPGYAQEFVTKHERIRVETIATGLDQPWGLAFLPDARKLVTERICQLRLFVSHHRLSPPLANGPPVYAHGQGGLPDVVLDPEFERDRTIYLSYAEPGEGGASTAVARARLEDGRLADVRVIFRQE